MLAIPNVLLRAHIAYFLWEVVTHPDDPRFAGKATPVRNLVIVGGMSLLFACGGVDPGRRGAAGARSGPLGSEIAAVKLLHPSHPELA